MLVWESWVCSGRHSVNQSLSQVGRWGGGACRNPFSPPRAGIWWLFAMLLVQGICLFAGFRSLWWSSHKRCLNLTSCWEKTFDSQDHTVNSSETSLLELMLRSICTLKSGFPSFETQVSTGMPPPKIGFGASVPPREPTSQQMSSGEPWERSIRQTKSSAYRDIQTARRGRRKCTLTGSGQSLGGGLASVGKCLHSLHVCLESKQPPCRFSGEGDEEAVVVYTCSSQLQSVQPFGLVKKYLQ